MKVSLIITTYNQPEILQLAIRTAGEQTRLPDEIVIADDGSRDETAEMIRKIRKLSPVPLLHVWQPDDGFRAARSRNNAITASSGDYLLFLDGDCFVNKYFVEDHLSLAKEKQFLVGTRVNIVPRRQQYILATGNTTITFFSWGTRKKFNTIRSPFLARLYNGKKGSMASANFSVWREDVYQINGFDESYTGHGGEDGDVAIRLENAGVTMERFAHLGMAYHFAHPHRPCPDWEDRVKLHEETRRNKVTRCKQGLDEPRDDCEIRKE